MTAPEAAAKFDYFATVEAVGASALYCELSLEAAKHPALMAVAATADEWQPLPALFLGCAEFLLRRTGRSFSQVDGFETAWSLLLEVIRAEEAEFRHLLRSRKVQTNEVRRSVYLYTALCRLQREWPGRPLALIELGTSAGFNLIPDQYGFEFQDGVRFGNLESPLVLRSELRGLHRPPTGPLGSAIVRRVGIDLNPVDLNRPEEVEWLRALIWPEHHDRRQHLDQAIEIRRHAEVEIIAGDAVEALPAILDRLPGDVLPVVFHTHFFNQLPSPARSSLFAIIEERGQQRDLVHLGNIVKPWVHTWLYQSGSIAELPLCYADHHGRWVEWLDAS